MSDINDQELFDQSTTAEPEVIEAGVVEAPVTTRDDKGRFAEKVPEPVVSETVLPEVKPDTEKEALVPSWRLREIREANEAKERQWQTERDTLLREAANFRQQAEANKPKAEPVDFFTDPNAAVSQALSPVEQRVQNLAAALTFRASRAEAVSEYGKDTVAEMQTWLRDAAQQRHPGIPTLQQQMDSSEHPVGVAMSFYQREKLLKETGGDLASYKAKALEEALNDPAFLAKAMDRAKATATKTGNVVNRPVVSSLPNLTKVGATALTPDSEELSDDELFKSATAPRRRAG